MTTSDCNPVRIGLVLSAGGLRGAAHVGVLHQLIRHGIPIHAIVGVSAGAVIAAYYAAAGLDVDELIHDAAMFRGRHLLMYSLNVHLVYRFEGALNRRCGVIPNRLRQLETATFDRLHHGVHCLGVVCHDLLTRRPCYFSTACDRGVTLHEVVRASASIPRLFPPVPVVCRDRQYEFTDGGISDPVPVAFARRAEIGATHVIVSDCRWRGDAPAVDQNTVWIRPDINGTGTLWAPRQGLLPAVRSGEEAITTAALDRIRQWLTSDARAENQASRPVVAATRVG